MKITTNPQVRLTRVDVPPRILLCGVELRLIAQLFSHKIYVIIWIFNILIVYPYCFESIAEF